jgi:outer membrane protein TolC
MQHHLEVLIGEKPGALQMQLAVSADLPSSAARQLLTTPAETLRYRPDVRMAERDLAAATATQGAAFAEFFPKISVAAFAGFQNSDLENLFRSTAFSYASGSAIMQPIFNFGRIRAGVDLADARQKEAYLQYEKTVLEALRETETVMTQFLQEEQRRQKLARSITDLKESWRLADLRYREGISTFLDVLDAERILYLEELNLAQSQSQTTLYLIALYKALGGAGQLEVKPVDEPLRPWG